MSSGKDFQLGEYVKVIGGSGSCHPSWVGSIGVVRRVSELYVHLVIDGSAVEFRPEALRKLSPLEQLAQQAE